MSGRKPNETYHRTTITPETAVKLLESNKHNRPISQQHVQEIARQISDGDWRFNGDTIKVAQDGDVIDGQHRLWAVIEAKKKIETIIVYGVQKEAFTTIDTIRKSRSFADTIALSGNPRYRAVIGTSLAWLVRWQNGGLESYKLAEHKVHNADIESAFKKNPNIVTSVEKAMAVRKIANPSLVGFFHYVLSERDPELADRLVDTFADPSGIRVTDPFFCLRAQFTNRQRERMRPLESFALMIKAANAAARNESLKKLSWRNQGSAPEPFPLLRV